MFIKIYYLSDPISCPLFFILSSSDRVHRHTSSRRWYHPRRVLTAADVLLLQEPSAVAIFFVDSNKAAVTKSVLAYMCHYYVSLSPFFFSAGKSNTKLYFNYYKKNISRYKLLYSITIIIILYV